MSGVPDGIYSVAVMGGSGGSLVVLRIENGTIKGNDTSGASYAGSIHDHDRDHVKLVLDVTLAPDTFGVWGTSTTDTHQTRQFNEIVPKSVFNRKPHELPGYGMTVMATRIPDGHGYLADDDGLETHIQNLQAALDSRRH